MPTDRYDSFGECYVAMLERVARRPESVNAPRGHCSREILGVAFVLTNPANRLIVCAARRANPVFNFAEALWYLAGQDDVESIAYYAPSIRQYSNDGVRLRGTAYGSRIFDYEGINQWQSVADTLRDDRDSKRAVIQIFSPNELVVSGNIDVACTLALQFLVRASKLDLVAYMRANDAYRGMVSDVFSFTFLQEVMARQLGLELGRYIHFVGSLHIYDPDTAAVDAVLAAAIPANEVSAVVPAIPPGDPWPEIERVQELERLLRTGAMQLDAERIMRLPLRGVWRDVVALLETYRAIRAGARADCDVLDLLSPPIRAAVEHRWPETTRARQPGPARFFGGRPRVTRAPRVYLAASIRGGRQDADAYTALVAAASEVALVLTEQVVDPERVDAGLTDRTIHNRDLHLLASADVVIAEVSTPSLGVGYELAHAVMSRKPTLALYRVGAPRELSAMIAGASAMTVTRYRTTDEACEIAVRFIKEAADGADSV